MSAELPSYVREIKQRFRDKKFKRRFERETGYPITIYENEYELATAFILHRDLHKKNISFEYERAYYDDNRSFRTPDWSLSEEIVVRDLPPAINVLNWPSGKSVRCLETKGSSHLVSIYRDRSKEEMLEIMSSKKKRKRHYELLQREFLRLIGIDILILGIEQIKFYFYEGLLPDTVVA